MLTQKEPVIEAKLVIESKQSPAKEPIKTSIVSTTVNPDVKTGKLGSLSKIRQQIASQNALGSQEIALTDDALKKAWDAFIEILSAKKNHSAVTNFKMARLEIVDENSIDIITESNIHQKFIESERSGLIHHLQEYFKNRKLKYQVIIHEKESGTEIVEKTMTRKEQYQQIAEQYPLVHELKQRLKLELD